MKHPDEEARQEEVERLAGLSEVVIHAALVADGAAITEAVRRAGSSEALFVVNLGVAGGLAEVLGLEAGGILDADALNLSVVRAEPSRVEAARNACAFTTAVVHDDFDGARALWEMLLDVDKGAMTGALVWLITGAAA